MTRRVLPILFNTEMVGEILDGRKTVTRRLVKPPYFIDGDETDPKTIIAMRTAPKGSWLYRKIGDMPYEDKPYKIGDILYVRETWNDFGKGYIYKESWRRDGIEDIVTWHPSIHMPKEAARIWLEVTDVRLERLQDMETEDNRNYIAEGAADKHDFIRIWDSTVKDKDKYGWYANPWVWVIEFKRCEIMKCSELQPGDEVVFYVDVYGDGIESVYDGYVSYVCKTKKLVHVNYVDEYQGMSDVIPFDKMVAKADEAGEEMVFGGCIRGKSVLLVAE